MLRSARRVRLHRRLFFSCWSPRRLRRLDVGVEAEQVHRVVTLLELGEPCIVVAVGRLRTAVARIAAGNIHVVAARQRLELHPGAPYPLHVALGSLAWDFPGSEYVQVVT